MSWMTKISKFLSLEKSLNLFHPISCLKDWSNQWRIVLKWQECLYLKYIKWFCLEATLEFPKFKKFCPISWREENWERVSTLMKQLLLELLIKQLTYQRDSKSKSLQSRMLICSPFKSSLVEKLLRRTIHLKSQWNTCKGCCLEEEISSLKRRSWHFPNMSMTSTSLSTTLTLIHSCLNQTLLWSDSRTFPRSVSEELLIFWQNIQLRLRSPKESKHTLN